MADAAVAGTSEKLVDELGDLLFQVYFLALLLEERGEGDLAAVARTVHDKLVRRHPHVFGEAEARTASGVRRHWEQIKSEQEGRSGIFHDVPDGLPALLLARKVQRRAAATGFEYPDTAGALADLDDELSELRTELERAGADPPRETEPDEAVFHELGDLLFAAVNVARRLNVDPELSLRAATRRFVGRVEEGERLAARDGLEFARLPLADQDHYFDQAKEGSP